MLQLVHLFGDGFKTHLLNDRAPMERLDPAVEGLLRLFPLLLLVIVLRGVSRTMFNSDGARVEAKLTHDAETTSK